MRYFLLLFIFISCVEKDATELRSFNGEALGTGYTVQFYSDHQFPVQQRFDSVIAAINQSMSTYIPDSDISRINTGDTTVVVDAMFKEVLSQSRKVYKATEGYYDPTVGILVNAYGFGPEKPLKQLDKHILDSLEQYVGLDEIKLTPEGRIRKENSSVYIDFNSIAKGYCIDRVGVMLEESGVKDYLIEMGGELRARGKNIERKSPWKVGIENINAPIEDRTYTKIVALTDRGMAGSGNYRKFRIDSTTGAHYVHTVNPLTGLAEKTDVLSATIIAPTCAVADAYATACMAMGLERSKKVLENLKDVDAYLLYATGDTTAIYMSKGFSQYIEE
ncbi:FAD:protein FMN transferase [Flavimarina sp. Hel_I_48]|uniref:FAD:protein FMN transferase n=1 Tax=Flavimarina sp. Hel_I_48 TaxID=1392488 RepID=UPI0004DF34F2|nr:FAD:protein FMN transferase [Flavimarina sp. Hel_I_48]